MRSLSLVAVLLLTTIVLGPVPGMVKMCTASERAQGSCSAAVANDGTEIEVRGEWAERGTDGLGAPFVDSDGTPSPRKQFSLDDCLGNWDNEGSCFRALRNNEPAAPDDAAIPAITLTDLAQFAPDPVAATGEPDNLGVAGMPTNFVAAASVHTRTGALFGIPLNVRFTPVGYDFRYGDGDTASTTSGGQAWATLGQASFTPTATSHIYRERGTYDANVTVHYTAEVDLGTGWFPVDGQLSIDGPTQQIRIFEAHTALVARTCTEQPTAPGC